MRFNEEGRYAQDAVGAPDHETRGGDEGQHGCE